MRNEKQNRATAGDDASVTAAIGEACTDAMTEPSRSRSRSGAADDKREKKRRLIPSAAAAAAADDENDQEENNGVPKTKKERETKKPSSKRRRRHDSPSAVGQQHAVEVRRTPGEIGFGLVLEQMVDADGDASDAPLPRINTRTAAADDDDDASGNSNDGGSEGKQGGAGGGGVVGDENEGSNSSNHHNHRDACVVRSWKPNGSVAHLASLGGIKVNDVVTGVNGIDVTDQSFDDVLIAIRSTPTDQPLRLKLLRTKTKVGDVADDDEDDDDEEEEGEGDDEDDEGGRAAAKAPTALYKRYAYTFALRETNRTTTAATKKRPSSSLMTKRRMKKKTKGTASSSTASTSTRKRKTKGGGRSGGAGIVEEEEAPSCPAPVADEDRASAATDVDATTGADVDDRRKGGIGGPIGGNVGPIDETIDFGNGGNSSSNEDGEDEKGENATPVDQGAAASDGEDRSEDDAAEDARVAAARTAAGYVRPPKAHEANGSTNDGGEEKKEEEEEIIDVQLEAYRLIEQAKIAVVSLLADRIKSRCGVRQYELVSAIVPSESFPWLSWRHLLTEEGENGVVPRGVGVAPGRRSVEKGS